MQSKWLKVIGLLLLILAFNQTKADAAWPGACTQLFYRVVGGPYFTTGNDYVYNSITVGTGGALSFAGQHHVANANITSYRIQSYWWDSVYNNGAGQWVYAGYTQGYMDVVPPNAKLVGGFDTVDLNGAQPGCPIVDPCPAKTGQSVYDLKSNISGSNPLPSISCNNGCQVTSQVLWTQCINEDIDCMSSVKYTFNGTKCTTGNPALNEGLEPTPPNNCATQINQKVVECGGSLNISSFNFETCTGTCVPDPCHEKWLALVNSCGGIMAVSNWNAQTCTGICAGDPMVTPDPIGPSTPVPDLPPTNVNTTTKVNADGSKEITQAVTNTYNNSTTDGTTTSSTTTASVTTYTTTTYDSSGAQTSQSSYTTTVYGDTGTINGNPETPPTPPETFGAIPAGGFAAAYAPAGAPSDTNIGNRFNTMIGRVKTSPLFSISSGFFDSLPSGGSPVFEFDAGTYGQQRIDLSSTMTAGLAVLKTILLLSFGFYAIRAIILKR